MESIKQQVVYNIQNTKMAIWQYSFVIVPKDELLAMGCSKSISKEKYFSYVFWQNECAVGDYAGQLSDILPKGNSWSSEIILFGVEESSNIEIVTKKGVIAEMSFRFDFSRDGTSIIERVTEFCIFNGLALIAEDFSIISLNVEVIISTIRDSDQYNKFFKLKDNR